MRIQLPDPLIKQLPELRLIKPLIETALNAVEPGAAVKKTLIRNGSIMEIKDRKYDLDTFQRIFLISIGKAALPMSNAVAEILWDRLSGGVVIAKSLAGCNRYPFLDGVRLFRGNHPVPGKQSMDATQQVVQLVKERHKEDLFICLISGGGSALLTWPVEGISLLDIQCITQLLLECGANIGEMNTIRKHLDKGGGLCRLVYPAELVTLVLSDVIGNPLDVIASGPTVADESTFSEGLEIIRKYDLKSRLPDAIEKIFEAGAIGLIDETVRGYDPCLQRAHTTIIADNLQAARAASTAAAQAEWRAMILTTFLQGEARQAGVNLAGILRQIQASGDPFRVPACLIAGGETTVTVQGKGLGGRNLELALGAVAPLSGIGRVALFSLATDGEDGPTDAAGAIVTGKTLERGKALGLDPEEYLRRNDSYRYFSALGDLIKTGQTGTNVNDLTFLLAW
jgi:glycerate 2-kinase